MRIVKEEDRYYICLKSGRVIEFYSNELYELRYAIRVIDQLVSMLKIDSFNFNI